MVYTNYNKEVPYVQTPNYQQFLQQLCSFANTYHYPTAYANRLFVYLLLVYILAQ